MLDEKKKLFEDPKNIKMVLPKENLKIWEKRMFHAELVRNLQKEIGDHTFETVADFRNTFVGMSQFLKGIYKKQECHFNDFEEQIRINVNSNNTV
jgi:hypothetical protein